MRGERIECFADGRSVLVHEDASFAGPGAFGLWTEADARTHFDELRVRPLE